MRAVYFAGENTIEVRDKPMPEVKRGMVKIKTAYAALCATDVHMVTMGVLGAAPGMYLGHEASGVVAEVGGSVAGLKPGDKVVVAPISSCGHCGACKQDLPQYCENFAPVEAFSEYIVTDESAVFKIPADADLKAYALTEPMVCTIRAMDLANIRHGQSVAVSGVGGIGSILLNMVILAGAADITVIEPVADKRENALKMGAQHAIDPFTEDTKQRCGEITGGRGFDHVFEVSGAPSAADVCTKILANCGKITYFAVFPPTFEMKLNLYELYLKEGSIQTVFTHPSIFPRAIRLMPRVNTDLIIGKILPLEQAVEAFALFHKSIHPKILLEC